MWRWWRVLMGPELDARKCKEHILCKHGRYPPKWQFWLDTHDDEHRFFGYQTYFLQNDWICNVSLYKLLDMISMIRLYIYIVSVHGWFEKVELNGKWRWGALALRNDHHGNLANMSGVSGWSVVDQCYSFTLGAYTSYTLPARLTTSLHTITYHYLHTYLPPSLHASIHPSMQHFKSM